jgi:Nucleotidyl transferase AbiEii toxin, Type IV TA system
MASIWEHWWRSLWDAKDAGYPNTFSPVQDDARAIQKQAYDPALQQFPRAFRLVEPVFSDATLQSHWRTAQRQALEHILRLVGTSSWRENLVLRGSMLLKAWLGDRAREPADIDRVFRPQHVRSSDATSRKFFAEVTELVSLSPHAGELGFLPDEIALDDIWTYDRVPGQRIVFPWRVEGLPPGRVQMDVVFGEELPEPPGEIKIPVASGQSPLVWAVSKELSLAWKILWLETDMNPQGKDLYDAVMLAEQISLPQDLLSKVLRYVQDGQRGFTWESPLRWNFDWSNFLLEYPQIHGTARDWQERLATALKKGIR